MLVSIYFDKTEQSAQTIANAVNMTCSNVRIKVVKNFDNKCWLKLHKPFDDSEKEIDRITDETVVIIDDEEITVIGEKWYIADIPTIKQLQSSKQTTVNNVLSAVNELGYTVKDVYVSSVMFEHYVQREGCIALNVVCYIDNVLHGVVIYENKIRIAPKKQEYEIKVLKM